MCSSFKILEYMSRLKLKCLVLLLSNRRLAKLGDEGTHSHYKAYVGQTGDDQAVPLAMS